MNRTEGKFFSAPWGRLVWFTTGLVLLIFAAVPSLILSTSSILVGAICAAVLWIAVLIALMYAVRGYIVTDSELIIVRLGWERRYQLDAIRVVKADPKAMSGSIRLFGNGGLFGFTGIFRNKRLGNFRAYATDPDKSVVIVLNDRTIVVTPGDPQEFVATVLEARGEDSLGNR